MSYFTIFVIVLNKIFLIIVFIVRIDKLPQYYVFGLIFMYYLFQELVDLNNQVATLWEPKVIAIINEIERKEVPMRAHFCFFSFKK